MVWLAFSIGLFGGLHCIGMCGPLVLATASFSSIKRWRWAGLRFTYQLGRIIAYGVLGLMIATLGKLFVLGGWQNLLSILIGSVILLFYVLPFLWKRWFSKKTVNYLPHLRVPAFWQRWILLLRQAMTKRLQTQKLPGQFSLGFLNGLLPCGLVYFALATAALSDYIWQGFFIMAAFGAGTLPWLTAVLIAGSLGSHQWKQKIVRLSPYMAGAVAILLIMRGFDIHLLHFHQPPLPSTFSSGIELCE